MPELCWQWSGGKGFPTGCLSGPLNILVLWEERQGREAGFCRRETLPLRRLYCTGITKDRQGLGTVYIL